MANSLLKVQFEGIPFAGKTKDEVTSFFRTVVGGIAEVDLSTDGVAIVTFATADDADKRLRNPPVFDGVQLVARRCSPKRLQQQISSEVREPIKPPLAARSSRTSLVAKRSQDAKPSFAAESSALAAAASLSNIIQSQNVSQPQQRDTGYTKEDAKVMTLSTNADTNAQQVELVVTKSDKDRMFVNASSTETFTMELELPPEAIELTKVLMNPQALNLADYDCQVTYDEQNGQIILTGRNCSDVEIWIRQMLDATVSEVYPVAYRFLQTTKGRNWIATEFRNRGLRSVYCSRNEASLVLAEDGACLAETLKALGAILNSVKVFVKSDSLNRSEWNESVIAFNSEYMVLVTTDFDARVITVEGKAVDVKPVTSLIKASIRKISDGSIKVPPAEIRSPVAKEQRFAAEEIQHPASNITVVKGDITSFTDADVLVNPIAAETTDLRRAGVVSRRFTEAGTENLQQEFEEAGAPIWFGTDVTVTRAAGNIHAKKVFHPAIRKYRNEKSLKLFTRMLSTCLMMAEKENMTSIAFPTIGCGRLQYKNRDVANCFAEAAEGSSLQIYIVAFTDELYKEFLEYLDLTAADEPVKEEPRWKYRSQRSVTQVITEVLIEMPIVHPAIATLTDEAYRRIQQFQTSELQVTIDADQSTVTLTGKSKQDICEVKQRILKLIIEHEIQQRNLAYVKQTKSREVYLNTLSKTSHLGYPQYWKNHGVTDLSKVVETPPHSLTKNSWVYNAVESMVLGTWRPDRARLGRDARNLNHTSIEVMNIWVVENLDRYTEYQSKLKSFAVRAAKTPFKSITDLEAEPEIMTKQLKESATYLNDQLISEVNEAYLLHGTIHVDEIIKNGIDSRFCGDKVLFGKGAYFAESSTKADQYADSRNHRTEAGQPLFMFLSRVLLGEPFLCQEARPYLKKAPCSTMGCKKDSCTKHPMCDSVVGTHREVDTPLLFREFIVYHPDQCYPEFLVQYKRTKNSVPVHATRK